MSTLSPNLSVYTDGASRSNPGHAACAYLVALEGKGPFKTHHQYLGDKVTSNQAEYRGMELALAYLVELICVIAHWNLWRCHHSFRLQACG